MGIHFVASIDMRDSWRLDIGVSTLWAVVAVRSNRGGMMDMSDNFTQDFELGFWIAESKMSRMRISFCFVSPGFMSVFSERWWWDRLASTVGIQSIDTKWSDVHIEPPSSVLEFGALSSRDNFMPASSRETRLGDVVIEVDGVEIAELMAAAVAAAAPIAPPG